MLEPGWQSPTWRDFWKGHFCVAHHMNLNWYSSNTCVSWMGLSHECSYHKNLHYMDIRIMPMLEHKNPYHINPPIVQKLASQKCFYHPNSRITPNSVTHAFSIFLKKIASHERSNRTNARIRRTLVPHEHLSLHECHYHTSAHIAQMLVASSPTHFDITVCCASCSLQPLLLIQHREKVCLLLLEAIRKDVMISSGIGQKKKKKSRSGSKERNETSHSRES